MLHDYSHRILRRRLNLGSVGDMQYLQNACSYSCMQGEDMYVGGRICICGYECKSVKLSYFLETLNYFYLPGFNIYVNLTTINIWTDWNLGYVNRVKEKDRNYLSSSFCGRNNWLTAVQQGHLKIMGFVFLWCCNKDVQFQVNVFTMKCLWRI